MDPIGMLRRRLFRYASDPWEGETLALKVALIEATKNWESRMGGSPCPIVFDNKGVCETMELDAKQSGADKILECYVLVALPPPFYFSEPSPSFPLHFPYVSSLHLLKPSDCEPRLLRHL